MTTITISRGDIFRLAESGKAVGAEIRKTRPCVVIQNDTGNYYGQTTIVALITSFKEGKKPYPFKVFISAKETGLPLDSLILCNQIQTVDKSRLIKKLGTIPETKMKIVDMAIIQQLDLDYT